MYKQNHFREKQDPQ